MAIMKVIEILANSENSWEDAAQNAVTQASKSIKNIKSLYVQNFNAVVEDGKIVEYRVNAKITFKVNT
ncbi:MAG TPA: dodecin domain-containing protein [Bacteroidetes bacterium]|nr:dodecin domain-containing protein [Bacteroidota bacterium]